MSAPPTLVIGNKNYSSWSLRAWLTLRMLDVSFTEVRIPLDTPEFARRVAEYSQAGRVPVLVHGDVTVWDSLAIAEYVAETWAPERAWPRDPGPRATARSLSAEMHSGFAALRDTMPMNCRRRLPGFRPEPAARADIARITAAWQQCLETPGRSDEGPWLFGRFCIADAMFAPVVMRLLTYDVALDGAVRGYADHLVRSEPMRQWLDAARAEVEVIESEEVAWP